MLHQIIARPSVLLLLLIFIFHSRSSLSFMTPFGSTKKSFRSLQSWESTDSANVEDILPKERRENLFQFLLRDLQVEGVPLLGVDADQVESVQAALWTTMAELLSSHQASEASQKACLIFESIPIDALRMIVENFSDFQNIELIANGLPELALSRLSLVGRGVGPAVIVQVGEEQTERTKDDGKHNNKPKTIVDVELPISTVEHDELKLIASMKMFVDRITAQSDDNIGLQADRASYRVCKFADVCHMLSSFWNCVCELQVTSSGNLSSLILLLPDLQDYKRFAALTELLSRSLELFRGDDVLELAYFHPQYDRDKIIPPDYAAFGHLPPSGWLPSIMEQYGDASSSPLSSEDLLLFNYQRRAPVPAVMLKRVASMENEAADNKESGPSELTVNLETMTVAGLPLLAKSIQSLADAGSDSLQESLRNERNVANETAFS